MQQNLLRSTKNPPHFLPPPSHIPYSRRQVYTGFKSRFLGRVGTAFFILVTYLLTLIWCLLCFVLVVLAFFFVISQTHCERHGNGQHWDSADCFNVTVILDGFPIDLPIVQGEVCFRLFSE